MPVLLDGNTIAAIVIGSFAAGIALRDCFARAANKTTNAQPAKTNPSDSKPTPKP